MQPLTEVPLNAGEKETLMALLDLQRASLVAITAGCSDEDLRKRLVSSETTILGIIKHVAHMERWWIQDRFAGRRLSYPFTEEDPDAEFRIEPQETTQDILDLYAAACAESNAIIEASDLDDQGLDDRGGTVKRMSLRWIIGRMIAETARHAGHADILREQMDGATGLGHASRPSL